MSTTQVCILVPISYVRPSGTSDTPVEMTAVALQSASCEFEPMISESEDSESRASRAEASGDGDDFDPRDPFRGGNPLTDLPLKELLRRSPQLLLQYWYASYLFYRANMNSLRTELLSGLTIACMQTPTRRALPSPLLLESRPCRVCSRRSSWGSPQVAQSL